MQTLKKSEVAEKRFIAADLEKCTGCGTCELVCAIKRENVYSPRFSRIKILRLYRLVNMAVVCRQCEDAPCVIACPQECLVQSESTGVIMVDEDKCDCCGWCMDACPYGAITINPEKETVMVCDLCEGDPQCVEWCPEEALDFVTQKDFNENIRKATANKLIKENLRLSESSSDGEATEKEKAEKLETIEQSLNLLIEAFSEPSPIEILIYGMFVKKKLGSIVPRSKEKIEKTLEWLSDAIDFIEKHEFPDTLAPI
jgi:carbon-monoxide dehydrogenase iron sulfur subunit